MLSLHIDFQATVAAAILLVISGILNAAGQDLWTWVRSRIRRRCQG